jgi:hypothetical protein
VVVEADDAFTLRIPIDGGEAERHPVLRGINPSPGGRWLACFQGDVPG